MGKLIGGGHVCAVNSCKSNSSKSKMSFFLFPKDQERARVWAKACGRDDLTDKAERLHRAYRICGGHFETKYFLNDLRNRLQPNAVPTIFPTSEGSTRSTLSDHEYAVFHTESTVSVDKVTAGTQDLTTFQGSATSNVIILQDILLNPEEGSENEEVANETETSLDDDDSWSCLETSALIATYGQHRNSFTRDGHELLAWDHISADLSSKNIHKTPESCEKKWKALFQIYLFNKRKPNRINFEYQNEIDEVIGDERVEAENGKRKRVCECSERKISEKNRRHRERMEMMKGKLDIEKQKLAAFQQYLAYLESRGD